MASFAPSKSILEDPILATFLPTIDTCLYDDGTVLRIDFELLIFYSNFRP